VDDPVEQIDHRISGGPMRPATGSSGLTPEMRRETSRVSFLMCPFCVCVLVPN
jgi:hypothetical protein